MSGVNLTKGQKVNLSKDNPGLSKIMIGLGWNEKDRAAGGPEFDLDASLYLLGSDGKVTDNNDFIFYNNLKNANESVVHQGDNLVGGSGGDDENIMIDLNNVPAKYDKAVIVVTIYEGVKNNQTFGMVDNSYMRIVDNSNNSELAKYDLNFDASTATGVQFGSLIKRNGEWHFSADGTEFAGGLEVLNNKYGVL
jgi:tellurium resistance protein TerD